MALIPDFQNRIIYSDSSITDVVRFHLDLRDIEDNPDGILYPAIHTYKEVDLGGAVFPAVAFINGWTLQFPAGNWEIKGGNVKAIINPVPNCYVRQTQSAAYAVTSAGSGGFTPEDIAIAVRDNLSLELSKIAALLINNGKVAADVKAINGTLITGSGKPGTDEWRPVS